jgi:hypothetical protein
MSKRLLGPALLIDWRAQLPLSSDRARGAWRVNQSAQVINWRAYQGPTSAGGGSPIVELAGEADGIGNAQGEIIGPPVQPAGEADGIGQAQGRLTVGASLRGEADGVGNAFCLFDGGIVSITCITTGSVGGSPPTPQSTVLFDAPSSW